MRECPFCGKEEFLEVGTSNIDREGTPAYIYCGECGACGPMVYVEDSLIDTPEIIAKVSGWNERKGSEK